VSIGGLESRWGDDTAYLRDYFSQASEREITIEVFDTLSVDDAIGKFGNLLSSAILYSDTYECQAFLGALKGQRLVQGRGRFRDSKKEQGDRSRNDSNITLPGLFEMPGMRERPHGVSRSATRRLAQS
jgi:hypothetical protein